MLLINIYFTILHTSQINPVNRISELPIGDLYTKGTPFPHPSSSHTYTRTYTHMHIHIYMHIHTCTCTYTHIHMYTYMHAHTHVHIHTHAHMHTFQQAKFDFSHRSQPECYFVREDFPTPCLVWSSFTSVHFLHGIYCNLQLKHSLFNVCLCP